MTPLKRLLNLCCFLLIAAGISSGPAHGFPDSNAAMARPGIEQALARQGRVRVLIKLKESPQFHERPLDRAAIRDLQAEFGLTFAAEQQSSDLEITRQMRRIPWIAARISQKALDRLRHHPLVAVIEEDTPIHATLTESAPQIKADRAYFTGHTGAGVNVAVLDTGIDTDHPDLAGSLVWEECFLSEDPCPVTGTSRASGPGSAEDNNGHGSHVSGIITSDNEVYRGVASAAGIVAIKMLDVAGNGTLSDLVAALDWVADNHAAHNIRIANMSLGGYVYEGVCDDQAQSVAEAADAVKTAGIALFAGSGNKAADTRICLPACLSSVVSVGAVYDADVGSRTYYQTCTDETTAPDQIACFSNVSTVLDLLAPGARITSTYRYGGTTIESGTSMACPHAAAMAALLLAVDPDLTPDDLLSIMNTSGTPVYDDRIDLWFPRIRRKGDGYHIEPAVLISDILLPDIA